jgi:integrase
MESITLKTVKVNFNLRSDSKSTEKTPVNCVVRWDNQKLTLSNVATVNAKLWDKKKQRVKGLEKIPAELNINLNKLEKIICEAGLQFQTENNRYPSVNELRDAIRFLKDQEIKLSEVKQTLFTFIPRFIEAAALKENTKTQRPITPVTIRIYKQVFKVLQEFDKHRIGRSLKKSLKEVDFNTMDLAYYEDYKKYLTDVKKYAKNTVGKHIKTLKRFLSEAESRGFAVNQNYKHQSFTGMTEKIDNIYLTVDELNKIASLDLSDNFKLDRVRDLFLVGAWTGLRFSDFTKIKRKNIDLTENKIRIETQKTAKDVVLPILPPLLAIINKYEGKTENSLPPGISNPKMNDYIKQVAALAEINDIVSKTQTKAGKQLTISYPKHELVCTHTARRSFATNFYKMGTPVESIMKATGHMSQKTFSNYIKLDNEEHADQITNSFNRAQLKKVI